MEQVVSYILSLRASPGARSALQRAGSPVTEYRAYGYLAPWWTEAAYLRAPLCAFAGLAAVVPGLAQSDAVPVGKLAAELVRRGLLTEGGVERKLIVAQTAGLAQLATLLRALLVPAARAGLQVDYNDLYWLLRTAEHPDRARRERSRRQLLEAFYQELHPVRVDGEATSEINTAESTPSEDLDKERV
jgi:CRISPR type I-E-associated protein CasB/Cse2